MSKYQKINRHKVNHHFVRWSSKGAIFRLVWPFFQLLINVRTGLCISTPPVKTKKQDICPRWSKYWQRNWHAIDLHILYKAKWEAIMRSNMCVSSVNDAARFDSLFWWDCIFVYHELWIENEYICPSLSNYQQNI